MFRCFLIHGHFFTTLSYLILSLINYNFIRLQGGEVEIHPVHGAMECRRCVVCPKGFFSKSRSFKECKICRNCALEGKVELRKCSRTSNAKCGGSLPTR